jgi:murein DD-endopeptidase MepM/ murein hydrolase activator NlpD
MPFTPFHAKQGIAVVLLSVAALGFLLPETPHIPVSGASHSDWNLQSFWYYPWGRSGTHKGIDIFAPEGTPVLAATTGLIISAGEDSMGGNYVFMLGAKWRFHYYAHLQQIDTKALRWVWAGMPLAKSGRQAMPRASRRICITTSAHLTRSRGCMMPLCRRHGIGYFSLTRMVF